MPLECIEWAIEVDSIQSSLNLDAQEKFIVDFIAPMYDEIDLSSGPMSKVESLHFTRIFDPTRDNMGAYIRLRVFCVASDLPQVVSYIEDRLGKHFDPKSGLQRNRSNLDWSKTAIDYGGAQVEDLFRDHLHRTSQTVCGLLVQKQSGLNMENILWPWTHFFFNNARGYGRSVLELAQGAVAGFIPNV